MVNEFSELAPPDPKTWWVDKMYMQAAFTVARHSTDVRTQVGCTLVIPTQGPLVSAWNSVPEALLAAGYPVRAEDKNYCTEHAERRVVYKATLNGMPVRGLHLYGTWASCAECARTLIEFGVSRVVTSSVLLERTPDRWRDSVLHGLRMMRDAKVEVVGWRGELSLPVPIRFNGEAVHGADLA